MKGPDLGRARRHQLLVEWNDTEARFPDDLRLHDLVTASARRFPETVAVSSLDGQALSYRQLERRAHRLAWRLRELEVGPETLVGIRLERSLELVVSLLGILLAGGAYLPLEPGTPRRRLAFMLADARPRVIVTSRRSADGLPDDAEGATLLFLDEVSGEGTHQDLPRVAADHPAYVLYTSGSTGRPKAVVITHRGICNHRHWMQAALPLESGDRLLHKAALGFDASVWEIFAPLVAGACVVLAPTGSRRDPGQLIETLQRAPVTVLHAVASGLRPLMEHPDFRLCQDLRRVSNGGEALPAKLAERLRAALPRCSLVNLYGPSEATIQAAFWTCHGNESGSTVPIGRPITGARLYVLDRDLRPVATGAEGVLHVGGAGLARGYLRRPAMTAECFVPDPFAGLAGGLPGRRLYDTGDRARSRADGALDFLGRLDHQVKIRGVRVELGEVERVLGEHPDVADAAVVLSHGTKSADPRLVAYAVARQAPAGDSEDGWGVEHVEHWRAIYDSTYSEAASRPGKAADLASWDSSYTGRPLPADHMAELVHHTVERVHELGGRRVLEIGCGTGLLLLRIAPHRDRYLGTDLSPAVVRALRSRLGAELPQVEVRAQSADDFGGIESGAFDVVFCNSVIGHFPSTGYLLDVLENMVRATAPGGSVLIGDVRNLPLLEALTVSIESFKAPSELPLAELEERVRRNLRREDRLVVDPAFFAALPRRLPRITGVRVRPKGGRLLNELTRFRYDVVLELDGEPRTPDDAGVVRLDWRRDGLTPKAFRRRLEREQPAVLVVQNIPNARVQSDAALVERLRSGDAETVGELRAIKTETAVAAMDPADVGDLLVGSGYAHEIGWARCGTAGDFDLGVWRPDRPPGDGTARIPASLTAALLPAPAVLKRPWGSCTNDPLRKRLLRGLVPRWRDHLAERLPEPMLPAAFVLLDAMPRTPGGKIDRQALPAPGTERPELNSDFTAPRSGAEKQLAAIWRQVLGIDEIGVHDNFFELGGHSLLGTQAMTRVRRRFGVELPLRVLFDGPTVAEMALRLEAGRRSGRAAIRPAPRNSDVPLSFAQQRLWFLYKLNPESSAYNGPRAFRLRGRLDVAALDRALREVGRRHESLRTTFGSTGGKPRQVIAEEVSLRLPAVDLERLGGADERREDIAWRLIAGESARPFDLTRGPLLRGLLIRLAGDHHLLLLNLHHIITDSWSEEILYRELVSLYGAFHAGRPSPLPELPLQYADFAIWQRAWLTGDELESRIAYWRRQLRDLPALSFPPDRARSRRAGREVPAAADWGSTFAFALPARLSEAARALSLRSGTSLFITLLAVFMALLHRYTGQRDIVVGSPHANRDRQEIEGLIGFFVNMLVMRGSVSGESGFLEFLRQVREVALGSYSHQDLPFEKLVEELRPEREASSNPLFEVTFALHNTPRAELAFPGLAVSHLDLDVSGVRFDLEVHVWETGEALSGYCTYRADLLERSAVARLMRHFENLLAAVVEVPRRRIGELSPLAPAERHQLWMEWNDTRHQRPAGELLHQPFEAQAARTPERPAVIWDDAGGVTRSLSYRRLDRRARRLARHLRRLGVGPDDRVAIFLDRGPELVVAIFGVLQAGGAYLPLDADDPVHRLAYVLGDSAARLVLTREGLAAGLPADAPPVVLLKPGGTLPEAATGAAPEVAPGVTPDEPLTNRARSGNVAYVLYTSGSTGAPKGVAVPHAAICNHMRWMLARLPLRESDRVLQKTAVGFDASVWEFYAPLQAGAGLVLARPGGRRDPAYLARAIRRHRVTILQVVPSLLRVLLAEPGFERCSSLRRVLCGGEALAPDLETSFHATPLAATLHNVYGPTEATIHATAEICRPVSGPLAEPEIGRPISGARVHLLSSDLLPVPIGSPGELHVGGEGLARGYLGRAALTAETMIPDPTAGSGGTPAGSRLYQTGDLAHQLPDGRLGFLGRLDDQIKVRGVRVEPAEIEAALRRHTAVRDAAVVHDPVARDPVARDPVARRLVAFVVPRAPAAGELEALRREHEARWRSLYDDVYDRAGSGADGPDFTGWNSTYTGQPLPIEEMREWLDLTVDRILALEPDRVLEIGCGTGLLLERIAPKCSRYLGTDFSRAVIERVRHRTRLPQVELREATARDASRIEAGAFDTVVLNSVVQYLPDAGILREILRGAVRATAPGGAIFVGDVRDLRLLDAFYTSVEVHADSSLDDDELRRRVERRRRRERELVIDPTFFRTLPSELPRIAEVRIEPKAGLSENELTRFRYDVTLQLEEPATRAPTVVWPAEPGTRAPLWTSDPLGSEAARRLVPQWRRYLAERLPEALVPSAFMVLDALPLTASGKLDRRALPGADGARPDLETGYLAPRSATERAMARIWSGVLGIERVGVYDNFFELGGHSLLAIQVISRARDELRAELPLRSVFDHPTVAALSRHLAAEDRRREISAFAGRMEEGRI